MKPAKILALTMFLLSGCGGSSAPVPSSQYTINNIYAYLEASQDATGAVTTKAQLRDGPSNSAQYLYLDGDTLYSSLDKSPAQYLNFSGNLFGNSLEVVNHLKVMTSRDLYTDYFLFTNVVIGNPEYFAQDTPTSGAAPTRAYVDIERPGHVLMGESSVDLPTGFQITAPVADATISRANPVTLTWTDVDATTTMELDVAGSCDDGNRYTMTLSFGADTGTATLNGTDYFPASGVSLVANCRVAFILKRVKTGGVSSNFAFGSFRGIQQRSVQFNLTP